MLGFYQVFIRNLPRNVMLCCSEKCDINPALPQHTYLCSHYVILVERERDINICLEEISSEFDHHFGQWELDTNWQLRDS